MFVQGQSGYDRDGNQKAHGLFLMLCQERRIADHFAITNPEWRGIVRKVSMGQCGHFMMGTMRIGNYEVTLSGSYGGDGLGCVVPPAVYRQGTPVPPSLIKEWNEGGGWNSAGNEANSMREWATRNIAELSTPKIFTVPIPDEIGDLDNPDTWHRFAMIRNIDSHRISYITLSNTWILDGPHGFWQGGAAYTFKFDLKTCQSGLKYRKTMATEVLENATYTSMWDDTILPRLMRDGWTQIGDMQFVVPPAWVSRHRYLAGFNEPKYQ